MSKITADDIELAQRLGVTLKPGDSPLAILRLVQLVDELQRRVSVLEAKRR